MNARRGFTLAEILIVVVILGVLAAIVIPQFSSATNDAQVSSLRSNLLAVRKQIELYKHHHDERLPASGGEETADFLRRMTTQTDINGDVGTDFGPYLERIPVNSFNQLNTVRVGGAAAGANTHGWRFDPATGVFQSDSDYDGDPVRPASPRASELCSSPRARPESRCRP
jgi:general secretion pathway protein G